MANNVLSNPFDQSLSATDRDIPKPVSLVFFIGYMLAALGIFITLMTPVTITLALRVAALAPQHKTTVLSYILGIGALVALIANPLFGYLSDHTYSRFGRRRPWILIGFLTGVLALITLSLTSSLWLIGLMWCLTQLGMNASLSALVAIIPDRIPRQQRARISALYGMASNISVFSGAAIVNFVGSEGVGLFVLPALLGFMVTLLFVICYQEQKIARPSQLSSFSLKCMLQSFWLNPRRYPDFAWAWCSRFLLFIGQATLMTYQVYYLTDVLHVKASELQQNIFISSMVMGCCIIVTSFLAGWLSDRYRRRKIFVLVSGLIYAFGLLILIHADTFNGFLIAIIVSSLAFGIYYAVDQALVVDILPRSKAEAAKNMGIFNIANAAPQSLAPAIAPLFLMIGRLPNGNYTALFIAAVIFALLGALAIIPIKGVR